MITFKLTPEIEASIRKDAEKAAAERIKELTKDSVRFYFGSQYGDPRQTRPPAFDVIDKLVADHFLSEETQAKIKKLVEVSMDKAIEDAVALAVANNAKKHVFTKVKELTGDQ